MGARILEHIYRHPYRLMFTVLLILVIAWSAAITAVLVSVNANDRAARQACLQVNELRRELYVAGKDIGVPFDVRQRFLPTVEC